MPRGLFVGRFQPFHLGHLAAVRRILEEEARRELLLGIGSAQESYTSENPFTAGERTELILRAVREAGLERILVVPIPDIHRHTEWVAYLVGLLPPFDRVYTANPLTRLLFERAGFRVDEQPLVERRRFEGRQIRARLARGEDVGGLLPPAARGYLSEIGAAERLRRLAPVFSDAGTSEAPHTIKPRS